REHQPDLDHDRGADRRLAARRLTACPESGRGPTGPRPLSSRPEVARGATTRGTAAEQLEGLHDPVGHRVAGLPAATISLALAGSTPTTQNTTAQNEGQDRGPAPRSMSPVRTALSGRRRAAGRWARPPPARPARPW